MQIIDEKVEKTGKNMVHENSNTHALCQLLFSAPHTSLIHRQPRMNELQPKPNRLLQTEIKIKIKHRTNRVSNELSVPAWHPNRNR
jgi:hypothetical protein